MCRYFSHDVGAHYHRKIRRLRGAHGWAGYGLYWAILELLREEDGDGYTLPLDYNALKAAFGVPAKKIKGIVEGFGLFVIDEEREVFYSPGLIERMQLMRHKYQPPTLADEPPTEEEDERKAELSRKRAEAGSKGGKIGGKVYRPSLANSPAEESKTKAKQKQTQSKTDAEESKTKAKQKQTQSKTDAEESKTKAKQKQTQSKTALRGGNIGGEREKEENIFPKQSSSPQSVSVSERAGEDAGVAPRDAERTRESEAAAAEAEQGAEGRAAAHEGMDEYYEWLAEVEAEARRTPSTPWGSSHTLVCALKDAYDQMRAENARWSPCKAITAEMMADARESVAHYGSAEAIIELMKRATHLPFLQGKSNLQRLAWLLKLKTLSAIEEGAYTDSPQPPKPRGAAMRAGVAVPLTMTDDAKESLRKRFEATIIQPKTT